MGSILISFRGLAKKHNGKFLSGKQAAFLLSQCDSNMEYKTSANASFGFGDDGIVNAQYDVIVKCDNVGILYISHVGHKTGKTTMAFTRLSDAALNEKEQAKSLEWAEYNNRMEIARKRHARINLLNSQLDRLCGMLRSIRGDVAKNAKLDKIYLKIQSKLEGI